MFISKKQYYIFLTFFSLSFYSLNIEVRAQSSVNDATVETIESIGRDLVKLLDDLVYGERDPTVRLDLEPVIEKVNETAFKTPIFREAESNIKLLETKKAELIASTGPTIRASGNLGQRTYQSSTTSGEQIRTTGQYFQPSIKTSMLLFDFGAIKNKIKSNDYEIQATQARIDSIKSEIFLEIITSFYEVQRHLLQSRLARENLQSRKTFVNFIRERNELGASSSADVVRAESRVAGALELLANSLRNLKQAQANYRQYFNEEAEPYVLPKELSVEALNEFDLENYLTSHPDVLAGQFSVSSAEAQLNAIEAENKGSLSIQGEFSYSMNPGSYTFNDDISAGLVFSRDLYTGGTEILKKERGELAVYQSELELDKTRINLAKNIRESFAGYEGSVSAVDAQMLVLKGAKESYSITKELYAFSRVSLFEVLSSQEELFNSGTKLIDSIVNRALAKYQLLHSTQKLFEQIENEFY